MGWESTHTFGEGTRQYLVAYQVTTMHLPMV